MRLKRRRAGATALVPARRPPRPPSAGRRRHPRQPLRGALGLVPGGQPGHQRPAAYRYFRKTFTVATGAITDAQLVVTGDDTVDVWLNGKPLAASPRVVDSWKNGPLRRPAARPWSPDQHAGVAARNTTAGPAGLIGRVQVVAAGGTTALVTDGSWKACQSVAAGWEQPGFNDHPGRRAATSARTASRPWNTTVLAPDPNAASPLTVAAATTEHQVNPLGVDAARPRFSWQLASTAGSSPRARTS